MGGAGRSGRFAALNIFFDVDGTILGDDGTLRPHTHSVFERLVSSGHAIYIWSGAGLRTAEIRAAGLERWVSGVYRKPLFEFIAGLTENRIPIRPDFVVDDYPVIVEHFGGLRVKHYDGAAAPDDELLAVLALVAAAAGERPVPGDGPAPAGGA
jgi:hypothetical protein